MLLHALMALLLVEVQLKQEQHCDLSVQMGQLEQTDACSLHPWPGAATELELFHDRDLQTL